MKKTIYILWRFPGLDKTLEAIIPDSENKIIYIKYPKLDKNKAAVVQTDFFGEHPQLDKGKDLILLHNKPFELLDSWKNQYPDLVEDFGDAVGLIYDNVKEGGFDIVGRTNESALKDVDEKMFNNLWLEYNLKKKLERLKEKTVNLWLPLVIDTQGIKIIEDDETRKDYIEEAEADIDNYVDEYGMEWKKVSEKLINELNKGIHVDNIKNCIKQKVEFPGGEITATSLKSLINKGEDKNIDITFFSKWLYNVIDIIDRKIKFPNEKTICN